MGTAFPSPTWPGNPTRPTGKLYSPSYSLTVEESKEASQQLCQSVEWRPVALSGQGNQCTVLHNLGLQTTNQFSLGFELLPWTVKLIHRHAYCWVQTKEPDLTIQATSETTLRQRTRCISQLSHLVVPLALTSELWQWPQSNIAPDSKPHLTKVATSLPIQNPKLSWLVRFHKSKHVKYGKGDHLLKSADTNTRNQRSWSIR